MSFLLDRNLTPLYQYMPLIDILDLSVINKDTKVRYAESIFWIDWFEANGATLPDNIKSLNFKQIINGIKEEILVNPGNVMHIWQKFRTDPKFLFPGIEWFIGFSAALSFAFQVNNKYLIDYFIEKIKKHGPNETLDNKILLVLADNCAIDIIHAIPSRYFLVQHDLNYFRPRLAEIIGRVGSIELYEAIYARYSEIVDKHMCEFYALYYSNMELAKMLNDINAISDDFTKEVALLFHKLDRAEIDFQMIGRHHGRFGYHIAKYGLFDTLDKIMTSPQKIWINLSEIYQIAMNENQIEFLELLFTAPWFSVITRNEITIEEITTASPEAWKLLTKNDELYKVIDELTSVVWHGDRFDSIVYLRNIGKLLGGDYIPKTVKLIDTYCKM